jgi:hypothetical protein
MWPNTQVPGHHVQVDVTFLTLNTERGKAIRRFQYTAIDDATRIRALKIYTRHTQKNAINFIDYVIEKFPFRINMDELCRGNRTCPGFGKAPSWILVSAAMQLPPDDKSGMKRSPVGSSSPNSTVRAVSAGLVFESNIGSARLAAQGAADRTLGGGGDRAGRQHRQDDR